MNKARKMHKLFVVAGGVLLTAGAAVAQDSFPKIETSPAFMYIHTGELFGGDKALNCVGGGGTFAYNFTSVIGFAADLGGCKLVGLNDTYGLASRATGSEFTFLFGPRLTFNRKGKIHPFFDLNFGGVRAAVSCNNGNLGNNCGATGPVVTPPIVIPNPNATEVSKVAFGLSVGGGVDVQLSKRVALRLVQAEYLYTRFGNDCQFAVCSNNNSQNSFRLKSGLVFSFGGGN
jgi:opacity protein-like surface antigen